MTTKTVNSQGMAWEVISANERSTTQAGRFFTACRCRPGAPWYIYEHDQCLITHGQAKPLRVWANRYDVTMLSDAVRCIIGDLPGHHPSESWQEHWARLRASGPPN